jgi:GxxExxY protein
MIAEQITYDIRGAAFKVHRKLGPGLLESAYQVCLVHELRKNGYDVQEQVLVPIVYDDIVIDKGYRMDLLVANEVVIELKAVKEVNPVFVAQLLTYMRLAELRVGLLINFHVKNLQHGIQRYVL